MVEYAINVSTSSLKTIFLEIIDKYIILHQHNKEYNTKNKSMAVTRAMTKIELIKVASWHATTTKHRSNMFKLLPLL